MEKKLEMVEAQAESDAKEGAAQLASKTAELEAFKAEHEKYPTTKKPGVPVVFNSQQLISIQRGSEGWTELGQALTSGILHESEVGLLVVEPDKSLHVGTAVVNLADARL